MANEAAQDTIAKAIEETLEARPSEHPGDAVHLQELVEHRQRAQAFFQAFSDSIRPVHTSLERRAFVNELLLRAQENQLFDPTQEPR